ncbi:hypothetical protein CDAR_594721 [Caerostris darwini]|uniref:Uncharacterized protein n=1 Tax=Caerostris darwini TaxID=1538125 RepID=A0AAV4WSG0_9ARAC|nr:hypothetical protein CDAR_594721 [Caerostris darwini]
MPFVLTHRTRIFERLATRKESVEEGEGTCGLYFIERRQVVGQINRGRFSVTVTQRELQKSLSRQASTRAGYQRFSRGKNKQEGKEAEKEFFSHVQRQSRLSFHGNRPPPSFPSVPACLSFSEACE